MGEIRLPSRSVAAPRSRRRSAAPLDAGDIPQTPIARDPGLQIPQGAFGGGIGEAMESFGGELSNFAQAVERAGARQQNQFDATRTKEAELAFDSQGMQELQRRQLEDDPARPGFMTDYESWLGQTAATLHGGLDERVSQPARERLHLRLQGQTNAFARQAGFMSLKAGQDRALAAIGAETDQLAAQARRDPSLLDIFLAQGNDSLNSFADAMTPQAETQARTQRRASVILAGIGGLVKQDRYDEAQSQLASGKYDADLDATALARANAEIQSGRRIATAEVQQRAGDHFDAIAETGQGVAGLPAKAAAVLDPAQAAEFKAQESRARTAYDALQIMAFAPPDQVDAAVARLKPGARDDEQSRLYALVQDRAAQMMRRRDDSPAAYVMTEPSVAEAYTAAQTTPALLPGAIGKSLAVQEAIGIAPDAQRILPDAHGAAARIAAMPAAQVPDTLEALRQQYGKYWGQARGELVDAGLPAPYVVLGTLDEPEKAVARAELAGALTTGRATLAKSIDPQRQADIAGALDGVRWNEIETTHGASPAAMRIATELMAYRYAAEGRPNPAREAMRTLDFVPAQAIADQPDGATSDRSDEGPTEPNAAPKPTPPPKRLPQR